MKFEKPCLPTSFKSMFVGSCSMGAYFALLSRETFFKLNRLWLIISLLGGLVLPLIVPNFERIEPTNGAAVLLQPFVVTASNLSQNLQNTEGVFFKILTAVYGLGVVVTLSKLLWGFWKIKRLLDKSERLPNPKVLTIIRLQPLMRRLYFLKRRLKKNQSLHLTKNHSFANPNSLAFTTSFLKNKWCNNQAKSITRTQPTRFNHR